jgi:hypothetical protein
VAATVPDLIWIAKRRCPRPLDESAADGKFPMIPLLRPLCPTAAVNRTDFNSADAAGRGA